AAGDPFCRPRIAPHGAWVNASNRHSEGMMIPSISFSLETIAIAVVALLAIGISVWMFAQRIMRIRLVITCLATWAITWIVVGAISGIAMGFGDLHGTPLGVFVLTVVMGAILGMVSGSVFAPLFSWLSPHRRGKSGRVGMATVLGAISGVFGMSVGDTVVG